MHDAELQMMSRCGLIGLSIPSAIIERKIHDSIL